MECNIYTIYSITCIDEKVKGIYVGSTKDSANRQSKHKEYLNDKNKNHIKLYKYMNENKGLLNWEFTCLQIRNCTEYDARILERLWYDKLDADLNTNKPYITIEEKQISRAESDKRLYIENKQAISL